MIKFIFKRLLYGLFVLLGVVIVVFLLFQLTRINPERQIAGEKADKQTIENIKRELGLDLPVGQQLLVYLNDISPLSFHNNTNSESRYFLNKDKYEYGKILSIGSTSFVIKKPFLSRSYYLHQMYLQNNLIKHDKLTIGGELIDLDRIVQPLYAVTAEDDHIAPWRQCYRIHKYVNAKAPVRFVLSSSGHILGIVNPPANPPKRSYRIAAPEQNEHWEHWLGRAEQKQGTWWEDWTAWLNGNCGELVEAYPAAIRKYPALADAPGSFVFEK